MINEHQKRIIRRFFDIAIAIMNGRIGSICMTTTEHRRSCDTSGTKKI